MANLTYTYNGISSSQGAEMVQYLQNNSSTFRDIEQNLISNGIDKVAYNFGSNITHARNNNDPNGNPTYNPAESYQDGTTWVININTASVAGYKNSDGSYNVVPIEIEMAHEEAHATDYTTNPFLGTPVLGSSEQTAVSLQNQVAADINASQGTNLTTNAVAGQAAIGNADSSIGAGTSENGSFKTDWSVTSGTSLGPIQTPSGVNIPAGAAHFDGQTVNGEDFSEASDGTRYIQDIWSENNNSAVVTGVYFDEAGNIIGNASASLSANGQVSNASFSGSGISLTLNPQEEATLSGNNNYVKDNSGTGVQALVVSGDANTIVGQTGDTISWDANSGSNLFLSGSGLTVNATSGATWLSGDGSSATINGKTEVVGNGSNQTITLTSTGDTVYSGSTTQTGDTYYADGATIAGSQQTDVIGNDDTVTLNTNSNSSLALSGTNELVVSDGNDVALNGQGSTLMIYGNTNVHLEASYQMLELTGNDTAYVGNGLSGEIIYATNSTVVEGDNDIVDVIGRGDTVEGNNTDYNEGDGGSDGDGDDGGYGGGYGGYDFAKGSAALNSLGVDVGSIAQYDRTVANDPVAAAEADHARQQAAVATLAASALGAITTPEFEGPKWQSSIAANGTASGIVVTWSFASSAGTAADPFSGYIDAQYKATIEKAMQAWASASGIAFDEVPDSATSDIRIGWGDFGTPSTGILGYTDLKEAGGAIQPGVIIRLEDPSETALYADANGQSAYTGAGASLYQVALHEIGRAIGLADDADPNSVMFASASSGNQTLDATDIAGARFLGGLSTSVTSTAPLGPLSASPGTAAASAIDLGQTSVSQMIQAMATMSSQGAPQLSSLAAAAAAPQQQTIAAASH